MNLRGLIALVLGGSFVSALLFQSIYMMISPERWAKSRYALKSAEITEAAVSGRWGRIWFRIIGFVSTAIIALYVFFFISHLRSR